MAPHEQRVVTEKAELDEKLEKLKAFVFDDKLTTVFSDLPLYERNLLEEQYCRMQQYSDILGRRIALFSKESN